jgi:4-amino-4-deoxychorismate lyase
VTFERVWVDGIDGSTVSAFDRGLQYGDGVFETLTCIDGRPRFLERHLERLERGRARLGLGGAATVTLRRELEQAAAGAARAILKLVLTRGPALARGYQTQGNEAGTRVLLRYEWPAEPPERAEHGVAVRLGTLRFAENPALGGLKHLNRLEQILARREWCDAEHFESLHLAGSGCLASGTMTNLFLVLGERLVTPSVERCGVAGIMRELVLECAREHGIATHVGPIPAECLDTADELFLTNVRIGVVPVTRLPTRRLVPGALTRRLQQWLADAR